MKEPVITEKIHIRMTSGGERAAIFESAINILRMVELIGPVKVGFDGMGYVITYKRKPTDSENSLIQQFIHARQEHKRQVQNAELSLKSLGVDITTLG